MRAFLKQGRFFLLLAMALIPARVLLAEQTRAPGPHPYLLYTNTRIGELKAQIKQDSAIRRAWEALLSRADRALAGGNGSRPTEELVLAYRMTGDTKYADKIKAILGTLLQKDSWEGPAMLNRNPAWHGGLDAAAQAYTCAIAFDAIYDHLPAGDRKSIADGIVRLGIRPLLGDWLWGQTRIHSLNSMGHNWWSASVFMAGLASLAVMNEVPEAREWAQSVADASLQWFDFSGDVLINKTRTFDRTGGYYESVGYGDFAMKEYLLFRLAWTNCYDSKPYDISLLKTIGNFFVNASYPDSHTSMMLNFGDSHVDDRDWYPALLLLANGYRENNAWLLNNLQTGLPEHAKYYNNPFGLLYNQEKETRQAPAMPALPPSALYADMGWGMLRSSWDKDATLLAVKCGDTWNHAHADAGSFVLFHNGENLLADGGTVYYNSPVYSDYFFQSEAHNVVLFNGEGQSHDDEYYGVKTPGKLYHLMDAGNIKYILADATGPTSKNFERNFRHFLWIGRVILVIDDLKARDYGKMEWLLHYSDNTARQDGQDIDISKGGAGVLVRPLFPETLVNTGFPHDFPEKLRLETREGYHDHTNNIKEPYLSIVAPGKLRQTKWITALILTDSSREMPKVERFEENNIDGVTITQDGTVTKVYLNLLADGRMMGRNSNISFDGWQTDAYLTAMTWPENRQHDPRAVASFFVANGSYLRGGDQLLLNSLSKVYMVADMGKPVLKLWMQGQPLIDAQWYTPDQPRQLLVNGKPAPVRYDKKKQMIRILVADQEHTAQAKQLEQ